jgi:hypothetical protein
MQEGNTAWVVDCRALAHRSIGLCGWTRRGVASFSDEGDAVSLITLSLFSDAAVICIFPSRILWDSGNIWALSAGFSGLLFL